MSDVIRLSSSSNRAALPVINAPQLAYVLIELFPGAATASVRMPLNFALLLDRSGSMAGEKLRTVKAAVKKIIDQLDPNDVVSILPFEARPHLLVTAQPASDKSALKAQVDRIHDGGGTNMAPALQEALRQVQANHGPGRVSRILLLTDGEATDREQDSRRQADEAGRLGIPIIGLGFGKGWKEEFLIDLADRSIGAKPGSAAGEVQYIQRPEDADRIFQDVYQSMQVVASGVQVTLRMVQGLEARRVWQVTPSIRDIGAGSIQGRAVVIPVGQLEAGGAAFLIELMLPPRTAGAVRIAQAEASYQVQGRGGQKEQSDIIVNFTHDAAEAGRYNGRVMNVVEKVQAFKLQTQALNEADAGNASGAAQKLRQAVTILLNQGEADLANQMQQEADRLEQSGQISNEGKKTIKLTSRKTIKLSD